MPLNKRETPRELRRTLLATGLVILATFSVLTARLYSLQVGEAERWNSLSENNRVRLRRIPPTRGLIVDSRGEPLVDNRPAYDVVVVPEDTRDLEATLARTSALLNLPQAPIESIKKAVRRRPAYDGMVVYRDVGWDTVVALETRQLELPGISLDVGPRRTYPFGELASHLLGHVGEVSNSDLEKDDTYRMGDLIGKLGAERAWEDELRGVAGGKQIEVDSRGRRLRVLSRVEETRGQSVVLTIDRRLQQFAEQLLEGKAGAIVAMRPNTGEVLAMASAPTFDPNLFARGIRRDEWQELVSADLDPLSNRALQGQYPPASTFKILVGAAALEEGVVTPFSRLHCTGAYKFGNRSYRCWKRGGHGWVNLHDALVHSCDVFFYQVGKQLGVDTIAEYSRRFGLGQPTGISLPNEKPGLIPTSDWKKRRFKEPWYAGETLSVAIGQGYVLATPLQMASVMAMVANGGTLYRPQYVDRIETPEGETVLEVEPEAMGDAGLRKSTLHQIREALRDVVEGTGGTGNQASIPGIEVGGKTGTAQVFKMGRQVVKTDKLERHLRDHAWFVAFAPVEDPEIVISVIVEHAGRGGGAAAAPLARDLADFYFSLTRGRDYQLADHQESPEPTFATAPLDSSQGRAENTGFLPVHIPEEFRAELGSPRPVGQGTHGHG